jgi:hypothetical protein
MAYYYNGLTGQERDKTILELRRRGHTYKRIAQVVGMTAPGVAAAYKRAQAGRPGRPAATGPRIN